MKLRLSLKSPARPVLLRLIPLLLSLLSGCSSSTTPTYLAKDIESSVRNICKDEYKIDVKVKLSGETLWIYLPAENIFEKADKPEKYFERFAIEYNKGAHKEGALKLEYLIRTVPEKEKLQVLKYNKEVFDKINNIWKALRRVIFSMERGKTGEPKFFCLVAADIKNGFEIREIFYNLDLKKFSYEFISAGEYQHRAIQETIMSPEIIGDKEGRHLVYEDITMENFIARQIDYRIRLKFQKPEVEKNVDVDKEIMKIVVRTLKIYDFKGFYSVELDNLLTNNRTTLNQAALWKSPIE